MQQHKIFPLIKGAIRQFPLLKKFIPNTTGGTIESRYCYSVWLRHLYNWNRVNQTVPEVVAELGPGDSLGIGFCALLSGAKKIYAFDVVKYWDNQRNVKIFDELVELFKNKTLIPDNLEYPRVKPEIESYAFPGHILTDEQLKNSLAPERVAAIRKEILDIDNPNNSFIEFYIPWNDAGVVEEKSVDFIYSQAVLECIETLENTFHTLKSWLKPGGIMSHTIDFKSHGMTKDWNGHWTYSDFEWKILKGGRPFLVNRKPFTYYVHLHQQFGFSVLHQSFDKTTNPLRRKQLAKKFKNLTEEELNTSGMYILSKM